MHVEKLLYDRECRHPLCFQLHKPNAGIEGHIVTDTFWIVWDDEADDYAPGSEWFTTKAEAEDWLHTRMSQ